MFKIPSWEALNFFLIMAEILLLALGAFFVFKKSNILKSVKTFIFMGLVFALNTVINVGAAMYINEKCFMLCLCDAFTAAVKAFVCDTDTDTVKDYISVFPIYAWIYSAGVALAVATTTGAAISAFGSRLRNAYRITRTLNGISCDIVIGNSDTALSYAKKHKNTIIVISENTEPSLLDTLVADGYMVIRRKISNEFLKSRFFNSKTKYNIIFPCDGTECSADTGVIVSYFENTGKSKNLYFYIETDENALPTAKKRIDALAENYCDRIMFFSRNELLARTFVSENPMTKYMPDDFLSEDTSLKSNVNLNMYFLGFGSLSREIYKQFVINNQFAVLKNGTYEAYPLNCFIYDKNVNEKNWEINGIADALKALSENSSEYFPAPEMPCITKCAKQDCYEFDIIKEISKNIDKEDSFSYILIDSGDVYKNIEIADRFELLLNDCNKFRIFIYDTSGFTTYDNVTCYGNTEKLYTHETIVNEDLSDLARSINTFYSGSDTWSTLSYFDMSSNISLASNLRFKLNLLGLDFEKSKGAQGEELLKEALDCFCGEFSYEDYFSPTKRSAMLAQEHFRWNAFHLMSGYLPMKKMRTDLTQGSDGKIKKKVKIPALKKHACITTYAGLNELTEHLVAIANSKFSDKEYTSSDFDYYKNDSLLLQATPDFFSENNYSVKEK